MTLLRSCVSHVFKQWPSYNSRTQEDSLKPTLDNVTAMVVDALSGDAREFYDREFTFFSEVTSISGKLKPFIKKSKPEKKVSTSELALSTASSADNCRAGLKG